MEDKKYFVLDFRKIKNMEDYKNIVVGHNARLHNRKRANVDPIRTKNNIALQELKYKTAKELIEYGNSNLKGKSRKLKKGSAFAFSIVVDCSQMEGWTEQDYICYLEDAYKFLKEHFKGQEVVHAVIHVDETKPHLHVTFSYYNKELGKWNQRGLMEQKRTDLNKLLNEFEQKIGKRYGLSRGDGKKIQRIKEELQNNVKILKTEKRKFIFLKETKTYKVLSPKATFKVLDKYKQELLEVADIKDLQEKLVLERNKSKKLQEENKRLEEQIEKMEQERKKFLEAVERVKKLEQQLSWERNKLKNLANELVEIKSKLSKTPSKAKEIVRKQIEQKYNIYVK